MISISNDRTSMSRLLKENLTRKS